MIRNDLWTAWLRRRSGQAWRTTLAAAAQALHDAEMRGGLLMALRGMPWVMGERAPVTDALERELSLVLGDAP
jgi:hypothetical protein